MKQENGRPTHEVRLGRIKAAIWKNQTDNGERFSVTVTKLYRTKDESGNEKWGFSDSFDRDDLLVLGKVLDQAHSYIYEQSPATPAS